MNDVRPRLIKCFSAVFPELSEEEIVKASADYTGNWDSLSWVTLLALVQEEFGTDVDVDGVASAASFDGILARVNEAIRHNIRAGSPRV